MKREKLKSASAKPFAFVLFGATGDLALRKILPALYAAHRDGSLETPGAIIGVAQTDLNSDGYRDWVDENVRKHIEQSRLSDEHWTSFLNQLSYVRVDARNRKSFIVLRELVALKKATRIFYLATSPTIFVPICEGLEAANLVHESRVVLEKPLGHDLDSSRNINDAVGRIFKEDQIYRIDHYLGKESVQNLFALRFGNVLFEPLWRREWIESIQITVAEELGIERRGHFYDQTGALRDMVQNHLLQLLSIVAMEPPHSMDADAVRDEKLRVLKALKPLTPSSIRENIVCGQYMSGAINGSVVPGYTDEPGVEPESKTETFVALRAEIENWRWTDVPFFLRTGKRLADQVAEIVVTFKGVPHSALGEFLSRQGSNRLSIRLQPKESIRLNALGKMPGMGMNVRGIQLDLAFDRLLQCGRMEAYQRLLLDVIAGRLALFVRRDEQETAWSWVAPIQEEWRRPAHRPRPYVAGSWGPAASSALLARAETCWNEAE